MDGETETDRISNLSRGTELQLSDATGMQIPSQGKKFRS